MKRSGSDWDLEDLLRPVEEPPAPEGGEVEDGIPSPAAISLEGLLLPRAAQKPRVCVASDPFIEACYGDLGLEFGDRDAIRSHSAGGPLAGNQIWSQNLTSRHSTICATIESRSSICAGSPTSSLKPTGTVNQAPGGTSGSDQSDDESLEIEAGACEQSTDVIDLKRMRRMVSNRESARRSRKRKQAHLAKLELQVDQLMEEHGTLYKQLTDANHQFNEAVTDNRVLKSDVEALRVKVKLAEDLVARGSSACGLDHLLQNHIGSAQLLNACQLCSASEVLPNIGQQADEACYISASAAGQVQNLGMENSETKNGNTRIRLNQSSPLQSAVSLENLQNRISGEMTSCGTDIWAWDSHTNSLSKQL